MSLIQNLQNKPLYIRLRIMWASLIVVGIGVFVLWTMSVNNQVQNTDLSDLTQITETPLTQRQDYVQVEWLEHANNQTKFYFTLDNDTDQILNLPKTEDITLEVNGQTINAASLTNRQNQPFAQKALSHTKNFGTVSFPATTATSASLKFGNMFFEGQEAAVFSQTLNLDLNSLSAPPEVRQ